MLESAGVVIIVGSITCIWLEAVNARCSAMEKIFQYGKVLPPSGISTFISM